MNIWKVKIFIRWNCLILACPQGPIFEVRDFLLFDSSTIGQGLHNPACLSKCVSFCMCYCSLKTEKSEKSQFSIGENSRFWPPPLDPFFKVRAFVVFYVKYKTSATTDWLFFKMFIIFTWVIAPWKVGKLKNLIFQKMKFLDFDLPSRTHFWSERVLTFFASTISLGLKHVT